MTNPKPKNFDDYIESFPLEVQTVLHQIRDTIQKAAPNAEEKISYAIPTFYLNNSNLVHFAAFKNHIGLYAAPTGTEAFQEELIPYKTGKGSIQFPLDKPLPLELITKIVKFRVQENLEKSKKK